MLAAFGMGWVEDFSPGAVKSIGTLEVLAAVGLILPAALGIAPVLVPLAAVGLAVLMAGAIITHLRRHEAQVIASHGPARLGRPRRAGPLRPPVLHRLTQRGAWLHHGRDAGPGRSRARRRRGARGKTLIRI
jgi:DoxX-like family